MKANENDYYVGGGVWTVVLSDIKVNQQSFNVNMTDIIELWRLHVNGIIDSSLVNKILMLIEKIINLFKNLLK